MKTRFFNNLTLVMLALLTAFMISCDDESSDDDEGCTLCPKEEGWYVYGTNTIADAPSGANAKMALAATQPFTDKVAGTTEGLYGKWMYIGAGGTLNFAKVTDGEGVIYGAENGGSSQPGTDVGSDMTDNLIFGQLMEDGSAVSITNEGLYYIFINDEEGTVTIMETKANIIGDATPGGWDASTALPLKSVSAETAVFEATEIEVKGAAGYRIRFANGYHVYTTEEVKTVHSLGVEDYATAWDNLVNEVPVSIGYFEDNIPNMTGGVYTITLTYSASDGSWTQNFEKTGDLVIDHSADEIGWFGNAYKVDGELPGEGDAWVNVHMVKTPTKSDLIYTWEWTVDLVVDRSFVLRDPAGTVWITWGGAAHTGSSFDDGDFEKEAEDVDNYLVKTEGTYDVTFTINAADEGRTINIEPHVE